MHHMHHPRILNLDQLEFKAFGHGEKFQAQTCQISERIGGQKLGYGLAIVPPGKRAWPYHAHLVNEEMFFVIEGEGMLRLNGEEIPIRAGDFISVPPGGDSAHQIVNTSEAELKYLCVSSRESHEVLHYPDSGKIAFAARNVTDAEGKPQLLRAMYAQATPQADYWDGE